MASPSKPPQKKSSYHLSVEASQLVNELEMSEGVLDEELELRLHAFFGDADDKMARIRYFRQACIDREKALRAEARRFTEAARREKAKLAVCDNAAMALMLSRIELEGEEAGRVFKDDAGSVFVRTVESVKYDEDEDDFINRHMGTSAVRIKYEVNKTWVNQQLKVGETIEGANLIPKKSLTWR